ncbi:Reverse transcriptase ribonuclease h [Mycena venus]|uniref:Reverse transcriptase ribonuclease h n=1 Tax=Mycena venus TaxID=2733690 RepID=A0A8H7D0Q0_9AGAR|nr:Reverse transcriptase ribonuclease h [Mycena venus]
MIASTAIDIWEAKRVRPIIRYEDDLAPFRFPSSSQIDAASGIVSYSYPYDCDCALKLINPMKTPWHPTKGQDFGPTFTYIGFFWDIAGCHMSLPEMKHLKFLRRIWAFVKDFSRNSCKAISPMKLHGSLCHITFIHPLGHSYPPALSTFVASFDSNDHAGCHPPPSVFTVLKWWELTLSILNTHCDIIAHGPLLDCLLFVDASTEWGIGILLEACWDAWRGKGDWKSPTRHIGWLECVALELLIYTIEEWGWHNCNLLVHSDNQGIIGAFDKGRSCNHEINLSIRRSHLILVVRNITLKLLNVPSAQNPAEPISRGTLGPTVSRLPSNNYFPKALLAFFAHA